MRITYNQSASKGGCDMKLIPEPVPWRVSPSENICEFNGDLPDLSIFLLCDTQKNNSFTGNNSYISLNPDIDAEDIVDTGNIAKIKVTFETVYHFSVYCPQYPQHILDSKLYDQSLFESYIYNAEKFHEQWSETGICPDPGFYRIEGSTYFQQYQITNRSGRIKHWLLAGHDEELHILAENYRWEVFNNE